MREGKIKWEYSLPKESGEYILTVQTKANTNEGNETIFAKFDADAKDKTSLNSYGFTHMDGSPIEGFIVAWAEKPSPYQGYFSP